MSTKSIKNQSHLYLEGIKRGDTSTIQAMCKQYGKAIVQYVETHGGNREDARDVLQEGLMLLYQKTNQAGFQLTSSLFTYFYAICRNIWMNKARKKSRQEVTFDQQTLSMVEGRDTAEIEYNEQYHLYRRKFLELGKDCQKVLSLFMNKIPMTEIMKKMGYSSVGYAKKRKFKCKEKLIQRIKEDNSYHELKSPSK